MSIQDYLVPFVTGGLTVAGIKYAGTKLSPKLAALIGAFPLGMVSSISIGAEDRFQLYLHNYPCMVSALLVTMAAYRYFYFKMKLPRMEAMQKAMVVWLLCAWAAFRTIMKGLPASTS